MPPLSVDSGRWLTVAGMADAIGVCPATIHRAMKSGILVPAMVTPGGRARFDPKQVDQFRPETWTQPVEAPSATPPACPASNASDIPSAVAWVRAMLARDERRKKTRAARAK